MRTLVVVPTYEEADNLPEVLRRTRLALPDAEVLVVDDDSPDGTASIAEAVGVELGSVHVLRRSGKGGLGSAYRAGFAWGIDHGFDILCQMDADLSHDPAALPSLVEPVEAETAEMVIGSRYVAGGCIANWTRTRRLLSMCGNRYAGLMLGLGIRDVTSGFRAYRAETLKGAGYEDTRARGYAFLIETAYRVWAWDGRALEVPITFTDRVRGRSKMSLAVAAEELSLVTWWGCRNWVRGTRKGGSAAAGDAGLPGARAPVGRRQ